MITDTKHTICTRHFKVFTRSKLLVRKTYGFIYVMQMADAVEKIGGVLTLLWHPDGIIKPSWWNLYLRILEHLKERNPWFGAVREVGEWAMALTLKMLNILKSAIF